MLASVVAFSLTRHVIAFVAGLRQAYCAYDEVERRLLSIVFEDRTPSS